LKLYSYTPSLDLHGMDREYAVFKAKEFIHDHYKMKKDTIRIIHGIGTGILKTAVHDYLRSEKIVKEYKTNYFNQGETVVILKI